MSFSSDSSPHLSILSQLASDELLARTATALNEVYQAAVLKNARAILVIGRPQSGKTELLRLTYDRLFHEQGRTLPIYFSLRRDRLSPDKFAKDFLLTLLRQYLAFVNHDATLVPRYELTERDLLNLAAANEYAALKEILDSYEARAQEADKRSLVRYALGLPQRLAARSSYHLTVLLDEAQWLDRIVTDEEIANLFGEVLQQPHLVSFILTGQQRALLDQLAAEEGVIGNVKLLHFPPPDLASMRDLVQRWCAQEQTAFDPEIGRLAVHQLDSNLFYLRALTAASSERKMWFDKGAEFERLYVSELLQGRIAHYFSRLLRQIASDATGGQAGELAAIEIVYICAEAQASRAPVELIRSRLEPRINVAALLTELHRHELVTLLDGHVLPSEDLVFCDWIAATHRRFEGTSLEEVKLDLLRRRIKSIPQMLALSARRTLHTQIEALLRRFDGQSIARSLFAHDEFVIRYGHATYEIMLGGLAAEIERVQLPQVVHVAEGHLFTHRSSPASWSYLLAFGFEEGIYDQEHEVVWLLAVADSPSAITAEAVQSLDQQLNEIQTALTANQTPEKPAPKIVRWAISKMGFTPDGTIALLERGFAASDCLQLELLSRILESTTQQTKSEGTDAANLAIPRMLPQGAPFPPSVSEGVRADSPIEVSVVPEEPPTTLSGREASSRPTWPPITPSQPESVDANSFEMAIPINDDKEIIAARVAERFARSAGFSPEAVNQIKTALIEACLSLAAAEETSEGKIYQRYQLDKEKMTIIVSNTAAGLTQTAGTIVVEDSERLWRLDVLRSLVDFVRLIKLDVGWRVELARFIPLMPES